MSKEDKAGTVEDTTFIDKREQLAPKVVKAYVEARVAAGEAEFNNGSILVRSKHPLDECLRRGIIEEHHQDSGKRIMTIRDCAFSRSQGRIYNDLGLGEDTGIDAATLYTVTRRNMTARQWELISLLCFAESTMDGQFYCEADYRVLYGLAPNIQAAFEVLDTALFNARESIKQRIETAEKIKAQ